MTRSAFRVALAAMRSVNPLILALTCRPAPLAAYRLFEYNAFAGWHHTGA
jgi:hypothetical protein